MSNYVLVVEDTPDVRKLVVDVLETLNVPAREAVNGQQALEFIHEELPAVVVLDLMMPVMDGFTFLTRLQQTRETRGIPVIVLSALAHDERQLLALPGVVSVVVKGGISISDLMDKLRRALGMDAEPTV